LRKHNVIIGGKKHSIRPMTAIEAVKLIVLLAPYAPVISTMWQQNRKQLERQTLTAVMRGLAQALKPFPDDFVAAFAMMVGLSPDEVAIRCTALELWSALPVLDRANDFKGLYRAAVKLGLWHV
jgi:hypothetical protein